LDDGRGNDPLRDGHRRRVDAAGGRYLGLAHDLTSANGEPPVELDPRAFCARYFPGRRRRYDLEAVGAYGAFAALSSLLTPVARAGGLDPGEYLALLGALGAVVGFALAGTAEERGVAALSRFGSCATTRGRLPASRALQLW
jgi:hypothetical protein